MQYGHFDDARREYVIETPFTPLPWINYLGSEDFFGLISNRGGGYCFYRDAKLQRLLRYRYNNVPADVGGRFYYLMEEGKRPWSPAYLPAAEALDAYECRHGMGYTVFRSQKDGLEAALCCFVPLGETAELHRLHLTNRSGAKKTLRVFGAVEWCLWNAVDDSTNFQRNLNIGEVELEGSVVYHTTEYRERRDHYAYYGVNRPLDGFDTDRDAFLGSFGDWRAPAALKNGCNDSHCCHGSHAYGWSPIAALETALTLEPGESQTLVYVLGYAKNPQEDKWEAPGVANKAGARRVLRKFSDPAAVDAALDALAAYWDGLLTRFTLVSGEEKLNRMVNIWNQYQCMATFNMSRSASYFESGTGRGMGFRDSCQDLLGFVHLVPARARERLLDIASIQFEDGSTYHQYQPLTKRGNGDVGSGFNDDPLWLVAASYAYIAETGDDTVLDEPTPFNNVPGSEQPLFEHLRRSVRYTMTHRGPHGLPLIGRADWNDCLNLNCFSEEPGESFQTCSNFESGIAESVFIAGMFVLYAGQYAELCARRGLMEEAREMRAAAGDMAKLCAEAGWDGDWFRRAYDAFGAPVGSKACKEGKIFIEPQGFCVMAGVGLESGQARRALDSVAEHLLGDYGVELVSPCYTEYHKELGEITSYPPGYKENGSVFCHNNPWISIAETALGRGDAAFMYYTRICPAYLEDKSDIRRAEPYVYAQTVAARASHSEGEAKNSWLTGTAAWTFVNISQYILGVKPTPDGLRIEPCLPKELGEYSVERRYRGAVYDIRVKRTGARSFRVNGREQADTLIQPAAAGERCLVEVTL